MGALPLSALASLNRVTMTAATPDPEVASGSSIPTKSSNKHIKKIINGLVELLIAELDKEENKLLLRLHVIHPILRLIYDEVYPYIMFILAAVIVILMISLVILGLLILFYRTST